MSVSQLSVALGVRTALPAIYIGWIVVAIQGRFGLLSVDISWNTFPTELTIQPSARSPGNFENRVMQA
jgi:hypothetical protein